MGWACNWGWGSRPLALKMSSVSAYQPRNIGMKEMAALHTQAPILEESDIMMRWVGEPLGKGDVMSLGKVDKMWVRMANHTAAGIVAV